MPRLKREGYNFVTPSATSDNATETTLKELMEKVDETNEQLRQTHLGHETNLWGEEVREDM